MRKQSYIMTRVAMSDEEYHELRLIALAEHEPVAQLIAVILRKWMTRRKNKSPVCVGESDDSM